MGNLTVARIKSITEPGRYGDGDGLMLKVAAGGSKQWVLRVRIDGQRRDIGLGSLKLAKQSAKDLACDSILKAQLNLDHHIDIEDEDGNVLEVVRFGDAIKVIG